MKRLRDHLHDGAAVALLCLLVIACTWRIGLAGRVLAGGDIFTYFYPYWAEATRAIRAARLPLWNPSLFMGVPFVANSQVGFFYPLNWPLWLLLPAHRSVHVTIVVHLCLAALNAYVWGRRSLRLGRVAGWTVGATFAIGGYLGAQMEHINQLQGLAWLPLLLTLSDCITRPGGVTGPSDDGAGDPGCARLSIPDRLRAACAFAVVVTLVLLAGHTQTAFISLFGVAVYGLVPLVWRSLRNGEWRPTVGGAALLTVGAMLAVALAAVQLLPTWQLSQLSVRAQGLPFNERLSFSLSPVYLGRALLPAFGRAIPPHHLEHVAYVGTAGLALAMVGLVIDLRRSEATRDLHTNRPVHLLMLLGLLFAFGLYNPLYLLLARYVPGFAHFRVPARWLALYSSGVAGLVGRGVQALWDRRAPDRGVALAVAGALAVLIAWAMASMWLGGEGVVDHLSVGGWVTVVVGSAGLLWVASRRSRWATIGLLMLVTGELFMASRTLPQARATAAQAFASVRPAVAHLLASERTQTKRGDRFLSMSDTTFDPGDLAMIRTIYMPQLSDDQLYDYIVATKQKEILSPNLPLAFDIPALDGYGGGLLPLRRYVTLQQLFLPAEDVSIDGRLRENLKVIPDGRWLSLFNVRHIITDKLQDAWIDDVFYDLQFGARLSQGEEVAVAEVPRFEATALGVVSHLEPNALLPKGTPVGAVTLAFAHGEVESYQLLVGEDVPQIAPDGQADVSVAARLRWSEPRTPLTITVEATTPQGVWMVRGVSLIDERTGGFRSLVLSDRGRFRLAHSGDVKIYENLDVLPKAFVVPEAQVVDGDEVALEVMKSAAFDPASEVVLSNGGFPCSIDVDPDASVEGWGSARATVTVHRPEGLVIEAALEDPGYLILTDAHYPGWRARVDGEGVPICRADVLFRAVALEPGEHQVIFTFRPPLQRLGVAISVVGLVLLVAVCHERRIVETGLRCYNRMQG